MRKSEESGIEELRILVSNADHTQESAFDGLTLERTVNLLRACRKLDLETYPDQLLPDERRFAALHGHVSLECLRRLYKVEGLPEEGADWEGHEP